jgi:hypothetical protein
MGAVLGIAAYGRTQEKLNGANNGGVQLPPNAGTTYIPPGQGQVNVSNQPNLVGGGFGGNAYGGFGSPQGSAPTFGAPAAGGFGNSGGFGSPAPGGFGSNPGFGAGTVTTGWGGKKAPPQPDFPEI